MTSNSMEKNKHANDFSVLSVGGSCSTTMASKYSLVDHLVGTFKGETTSRPLNVLDIY